MISRAYVMKRILEHRADLNQEQANRLIDDAVRLLGNLVHYRHGGGGQHEDDDTVQAALMIGQDRP